MGCGCFLLYFCPVELPMNLVIDIGNTFAKAAVFEGVTLTDSVHCRRPDTAALADFVRHYRPSACAYSSVATEASDVDMLLSRLACPVLHVGGTTPVPFRIAYRTPLMLGSDRVAAVAGALCLFPGRDVLVIDAGTCITFDLLTADGVYEGGNISPGPSMRLAAMHEATARLPLVGQEGECPPLGYDTETALRSGVLRGIGFEIAGYADEIRRSRPSLLTLLTGGKSGLLLPHIPDSVKPEAVPHLVEYGLNHILNHHQQL